MTREERVAKFNGEVDLTLSMLATMAKELAHIAEECIREGRDGATSLAIAKDGYTLALAIPIIMKVRESFAATLDHEKMEAREREAN